MLAYPSSAETFPARLLLVDDEPRLLASLQALLDGRGFDLHLCRTGTEAVQALQHMPVDLLILDLRLPDLDGHAVMDFMKEQGIEAPVIITSGDSGIDAAIGALRRGAYDYLRKPYSREELLKAVHNALQQRQLQTQNRRMARQLAASESMYRYLVDSSPDIIFTLTADGHVSFVNHRVHALLGHAREDLLGRHYSEWVHEQDLERASFVFSRRHHDQLWSRTIELRLRSRHPDEQARSFSVELTAMSEHTPEPGDTPQGAMHGVYGVARDITDSKRADALITYQAHHDILTQLPNRVLFKERLRLALLQARRKGARLAVLFVNLDRFKLVNDSLGHAAGDELLQQVALRLQLQLHGGDTLSRFGGDEFTVALTEVSQAQDASRLAHLFLSSLTQPFRLDGQPVHISASIGIALYPTDGATVDELIRSADLAMHNVKRQGRNGQQFFNPALLQQTSERLLLEHGLHEALAQGELEMYYQPQVDVSNGRIIGAEALMRWNHPQRGLLGAGEFLPLAEDSGLIIPITNWMLEATCRDLTAWNAVNPARIHLSINLSPHYLERSDFFDKLNSTLHQHALSPAQIEVEVTENICIHNPLQAIEQLNRLCQLGVRVAIDDFGTGYSSLSYLHRFPIHVLKIDRSFVMPIDDEGQHFPVILAIISIAKGLGLKLVAEGVETAAQLRYLEQAGCQTFQGYWFYKPMPQSALLATLAAQTPPR